MRISFVLNEMQLRKRRQEKYQNYTPIPQNLEILYKDN